MTVVLSSKKLVEIILVANFWKLKCLLKLKLPRTAFDHPSVRRGF
jgi:hypothetical protein